jgi:uncharacterized repeat protein (TIGR01451 family)
MGDQAASQRRRAWLLVLWALAVAGFAVPGPAPATAQEAPATTYLLRHIATDQFLSPDGWGPAVLAARFDGRMAQWERLADADGTVRFRHAVTGAYLDRTGGTNGHDVGATPDPTATTAWTVTAAGAGVYLTNGDAYLVANGFTVRTATGPGPQAEWELVPVELEAPRFVTLTNEVSGRLLAASGDPDGTVVTIEGGQVVPAIAKWELIEQVTTNAKCDRHPDWNIPNDSPPAHGDSSRVTTCHVLRNREGGDAVEADSAESGFAVTAQSAVTHDAYWVLSDVADGAVVTMENVAFSRYLDEVDQTAVTSRRVGATAWWRLNDIDPGCETVDGVLITSHRDGSVVDTTEDGTATGSFRLAGVAPPGTLAVVLGVEDETAGASVESGECAVAWSIEVLAVATQDINVTVTATGGFGQRATTISLSVIAPDANDVLVQPAFAETPQFHELLRSYDPATGVLVFEGDISHELQAGDGLGGGISTVAPDGYLRIVLTATFDGTDTIVTTRQAGLTEFVRQIRLEYRSDAESLDAVVDGQPLDASSAEEPIDGGGVKPPDAPTVTTLDAPDFAPAVIDANGVDLTLDLNLDPGADFDLDISWSSPCWICPPVVPTVERFAFEVRLDLSAQVELTYTGATLVEGSGNFGPRLDDYRFATISVPTPIGVPVVITFEAESQPFYEYSLDALVRVEYSPTVSMAVGFEHEDGGTGRGAYRTFDAEAGMNQLEFDFGIRGTAAVGVEIDVEGLLYGQAGIELEARPQLELEAIGDVLDREVAWELNLVVPLAGGLEIEIAIGPLGWELEAARLEFVQISATLLSGTFGGGDATLALSQVAPPGVFPSQEFAYTITVENTGDARAENPRVDMVLPAGGTFVSSSPPGLPETPAAGGDFAVRLDDLDPGDSTTVTLRWRAPAEEDTVLSNVVTASADNAAEAGPVETSTVVGVEGRCNPCGVAAAGVGLRNRAQGTIPIAGLPAGAVVTRAVLTWGVLYSGTVPRDTITFDGNVVTADVAATVSGSLCWSDTNTIGYSADVTAFVDGNGTYTVSDPPRGVTRVDSEPAGVLPYTDGASLIVFYVGGGANSQVISDFTYNTNTDASRTIVRSFDGINSVGADAWLTIAGPDGQNNATETFTISGATNLTLTNRHDGSDPQEGPSFAIGSLWDTDHYGVSSVLPAGQSTLSYRYGGGTDCIGVSAAVLEVAQA